MSSCSKIRQDNTLMKIQMRPHLKFPSRGKPQGNRIFRRSLLPSAAKGRDAFFGAGISLRRRGEIFTRRAVRAVRAPYGRHRAGNRFFARLPGIGGGAFALGAKFSLRTRRGGAESLSRFLFIARVAVFLLAKFRRKLKRLRITGRYSAF